MKAMMEKIAMANNNPLLYKALEDNLKLTKAVFKGYNPEYLKQAS